MTDSAQPWPINTELWHYTVTGERYEPSLLGHVVRVGKLGVTVRLAKADQFGDRELRIMFGCPRIWTSEEDARAWCVERKGPWAHLEDG